MLRGAVEKWRLNTPGRAWVRIDTIFGDRQAVALGERDSGGLWVERLLVRGDGLARRGAQGMEGSDELALIRTGLAHRQLHPPYTHPHHRTDLQ